MNKRQAQQAEVDWKRFAICMLNTWNRWAGITLFWHDLSDAAGQHSCITLKDPSVLGKGLYTFPLPLNCFLCLIQHIGSQLFLWNRKTDIVFGWNPYFPTGLNQNEQSLSKRFIFIPPKWSYQDIVSLCKPKCRFLGWTWTEMEKLMS